MIPAKWNSYPDFDIKITEHKRNKNACNYKQNEYFQYWGQLKSAS